MNISIVFEKSPDNLSEKLRILLKNNTKISGKVSCPNSKYLVETDKSASYLIIPLYCNFTSMNLNVSGIEFFSGSDHNDREGLKFYFN